MNTDLLRSFFEIAEQGSLNRAAERLRVSQSTLTRQLQALEQEAGARLFERSPGGVSLTAPGHALHDGMKPVLLRFDAVVAEVRALGRGQSLRLRIGYLQSAAPDYLNAALARLRQSHPQVKIKLLDLSPGEQIEALRRGEIDLAIIGSTGSLLAREFYVRRIATLPVMLALPEDHPRTRAARLRLSDFRADPFVGAPDRDLPGYNRWVIECCRRAGFRPRFVEDAESLVHGLATVATEGAISLMPEYASRAAVPGVAFRRLDEPRLCWDLLVAWQRGRASDALKALLETLGAPAGGKETRPPPR